MSRLGAVETLWLAERDGAVVGLSPADAQVWRDHLSVPGEGTDRAYRPGAAIWAFER